MTKETKINTKKIDNVTTVTQVKESIITPTNQIDYAEKEILASKKDIELPIVTALALFYGWCYDRYRVPISENTMITTIIDNLLKHNLFYIAEYIFLLKIANYILFLYNFNPSVNNLFDYQIINVLKEMSLKVESKGYSPKATHSRITRKRVEILQIIGNEMTHTYDILINKGRIFGLEYNVKKEILENAEILKYDGKKIQDIFKMIEAKTLASLLTEDQYKQITVYYQDILQITKMKQILYSSLPNLVPSLRNEILTKDKHFYHGLENCNELEKLNLTDKISNTMFGKIIHTLTIQNKLYLVTINKILSTTREIKEVIAENNTPLDPVPSFPAPNLPPFPLPSDILNPLAPPVPEEKK